MKRGVQIYIEGQRLDLFEDEKILINLTVQNLADISKSFTDFTQSFTIPASTVNNRIMQHFYENAVDATLDYGIRRSANIELDLAPFREGLMALEKSNLKNGKVESYTITFYGKLLSFKDLIGDAELKDLGWEEYGHTYNGTEVINRISDAVTDYDIRYPLISSKRLWSYGDGTSTDISTEYGSIIYTELFPAISISKVFQMIEDFFDIDFIGTFKDDQRFKDCYLYLKNSETLEYFTPSLVLDYITGTSQVNSFFSNLNPANTEYQQATIFYQLFTAFYENPDGLGNKITSILSPDLGIGSVTFYNKISMAFFDLNPNDKIWIDVYEYRFDSISGTYYYVFINTVLKEGNGIIECVNRDYSTDDRYRVYYEFRIRSNQSVSNFSTSLIHLYKMVNDDSEMLISGRTFTQPILSLDLVDTDINLRTLVPKMKITDFLAGIMKQFNLIYYPIIDIDNNASIVVDFAPLDEWLQQGAIIDVTKHMDVTTVDVANIPLYRNIEFKYAESKSILNKQFFAQNNTNYGNLKFNYEYDGGDFKIELPFENLIQQTFTSTSLQVGYIVDENYNSYENAPILLYKYEAQTVAFKIDTGASYEDVTDYIPFGQDLLYNGNNLTLNFNFENSTLLLEPINRTSFFNYYQGYLQNLYNNKQRLTTIKGVFPISLLTNLQLNDRLIIRDKRYIINAIQLELTTGDVTLELYNDFREVAPFSNYNVDGSNRLMQIPIILQNDVTEVEITTSYPGVTITPSTITESSIIEVDVPTFTEGVYTRITEDDDTRITEGGDTRIDETPQTINTIELTVTSTIPNGTRVDTLFINQIL